MVDLGPVVNENKEKIQNLINGLSKNISSACDLVGGLVTEKEIKQMTLEELLTMLIPNGIFLKVEFLKKPMSNLNDWM